MGSQRQPSHHQLGIAGESFVAQLLQQAGWQILQTRWRCRWGEIDIIAADTEWLIFVEVKTRQEHHGSLRLDAQGRLAVDYRKQQKICRTAQSFLAEFAEQYPTQAGSLHYRFDVALVGHQPTQLPGNGLYLIEYLPHAFAVDLD